MADKKIKKLSKVQGFLMQTKKGIKDAVTSRKSKRRVKKLLNSGKSSESNNADGTPIYKHGGIIQHD